MCEFQLFENTSYACFKERKAAVEGTHSLDATVDALPLIYAPLYAADTIYTPPPTPPPARGACFKL